jgi:tRNA(fMet)-specific endonuclease VapC
VARLILDTGVLVEAVRGRIDLADVGAGDDVAVPAIALAEYLVGVELDADPARQAAQRAFVEELLAIMPIIEYTKTVAEHHAALLAHVRRAGRPRGAHDLIIAATARATGRLLLSTDEQAGFTDLPDVPVRIVRVRPLS